MTTPRRQRHDGITPARQKLFLDRLAETCSVQAAVAASGKASSCLYGLRDRDPAFAEAWDLAIQAHYDEMELAVLREAAAQLAVRGVDQPNALAGVEARVAANPALALDLLKLHKAGARVPAGGRTGRATGRPMRAASVTDLTANLKRLLAQVARRQDKSRQGRKR